MGLHEANVKGRPVSAGTRGFTLLWKVWGFDTLMLCPACLFCLGCPLENSLLKFNPSSKVPFQILLSPCSFSPFLQMESHSTLLFFYTSYFILFICILVVSPARLYAPSLLFASSAESGTGLCTQRSINTCWIQLFIWFWDLLRWCGCWWWNFWANSLCSLMATARKGHQLTWTLASPKCERWGNVLLQL